MSRASTRGSMSPGLLRVAERARREPKGRFHSLAHLIDEAALERAFRELRNDAAVGVDGVTKEAYGANLEDNLRDLHRRLREGRYRHQPIRRVHIPKDDDRTRPIGISTLEDKIVQGAVREVLEAVYEQDFRECSYGFRPELGCHDALRELDRVVHRGKVRRLLEADIRSFFDSLDRDKLKEMLKARVPDGSIQRLVGKCLNVGVLDGEEFATPDRGTAQGSSLSPLLGNIYLHYVLDVWFEDVIKPSLEGKAHLIRYADDFVIGFERQEDAEAVMDALAARMRQFGLELHPDKTRLVPFGRPQRGGGRKGPGTFDFLGFTVHWRRTRRGGWRVALKTRSARLRKAAKAIHEWCRRHRHRPIKEQHKALCRRIQGHFNYFGVNGNTRCLAVIVYHAERSWYKWLKRRSNRTRLNWERFQGILVAYPLPAPRVIVQIWGR